MKAMPKDQKVNITAGNTKGGSTIDLLFDWFGLVYFANNFFFQLS